MQTKNKMIKIKSIGEKLDKYRYHIVIIAGALYVSVADENSLLRRIQYGMQINELKNEIAKYDAEYQRDSQALKRLESGAKNIEKVARERYFMKADDEDIFVLSDDERPDNTQNGNETTK